MLSARDSFTTGLAALSQIVSGGDIPRGRNLKEPRGAGQCCVGEVSLRKGTRPQRQRALQQEFGDQQCSGNDGVARFNWPAAWQSLHWPLQARAVGSPMHPMTRQLMARKCLGAITRWSRVVARRTFCCRFSESWIRAKGPTECSIRAGKGGCLRSTRGGWPRFSTDSIPRL